jgi:phage terminase large subunit
MFDHQIGPSAQPLNQSQAISAQFPAPLACLFRPKRHKVLWGGRSAGRSWGCARALLLLGVKRPIRVLCVRELQNSIGESVHLLLTQQIAELHLENQYKIEVARITCVSGPGRGTTFSFEGIKNNTTKIKSYEGIDYCWVEEANKVSQKSWEILLPTIRKEGSEVWITFNPELATDYTYERFVLSPAGEVIVQGENWVETTDSFVIKMTYLDNPWVSEVTLNEMNDLKGRDEDAYNNVWLGHCREMLQGAVFAKELRRTIAEGRICNVPWDRETPVNVYFDLGKRDLTAFWIAQRVAMQWRILEYFEDCGEEIEYYLRQLQSREYIYDTIYLPHDAKAKRLGQKRTIDTIVRGLGFKTHVVPKINQKVNAINAGRLIFPNCWFDEVLCKEGLNRLKHYCYSITNGQFSEEPLHDDNSNGADAFMTLAQHIKAPKGKSNVIDRLARQASRFVDEHPNLGWLGA